MHSLDRAPRAQGGEADVDRVLVSGQKHRGWRVRPQGHCCIGGKRAGWLLWHLRSDGKGKFGEGCWEPMSGVEVKAEFVVAAAEFLHERLHFLQ